MKTILFLVAATSLLTGCVSVVKYPPCPAAGLNAPGIKILGPVMADSGRWPLSLNVPPSDYTFYSALRAQAASQYQVSENQVALSEVRVTILSEIVGTIRDWKAEAIAGQNTNIVPATEFKIPNYKPETVKSPKGGQ